MPCCYCCWKLTWSTPSFQLGPALQLVLALFRFLNDVDSIQFSKISCGAGSRMLLLDLRCTPSSEDLLSTTVLFIILTIYHKLVFIFFVTYFILIVCMDFITKQGTCCARGNIWFTRLVLHTMCHMKLSNICYTNALYFLEMHLKKNETVETVKMWLMMGLNAHSKICECSHQQNPHV